MSVEPQTAPATPDAHRGRWIAAGVLFVVLAVAAGVYLALRPTPKPDPLEHDFAGMTACHQLADWIRGDLKDPDTGKPLDKVVASLALSDYAVESSTPAIKAAAGEDFMDTPEGGYLKAYGGPSSFRAADLYSLHSACQAAGETMPSYAEPS